MMKRLLLCICVCVLLLSTSLAHALQDLNLLDTSDAVRLYKADLIAAGYLSVDEAGSDVFNRRTKEATIELQKDYGLVETGLASPELQVIVRLLAKIENRGAIPEITPPPSPKVPDVRNMKRSDAIVSIQAIGQLPIVEEEFSNIVPVDKVISSLPQAGKELPSNGRIILKVSKGPRRIDASNATWYAWWFKGSNGDNYEMGDIYIEDGYLVIELDATINTTYKYRWRGYGTAAIRDTFDKVVPFDYSYGKEDIKKGETQKIVLRIPVRDLDVQKPTTLSVKIELYRNQKTEDRLRMDFTFAWP